MRLIPAVLAALLAAAIAPSAFADTAEVKTQTIVEVKKKGAHCEQDPNCFNRYHPAIKPVAIERPTPLFDERQKFRVFRRSLGHRGLGRFFVRFCFRRVRNRRRGDWR